jgi:hypothetical protein|tara:strand:- start:471 stop:746 length:276 start_codon:yes stop_codon:yes gene_type:complete
MFNLIIEKGANRMALTTKIDNFVDQAYQRLEALDPSDNQELAEIERIEQELYEELMEANYNEISKTVKDHDDIELLAERMTESMISWRNKR